MPPPGQAPWNTLAMSLPTAHKPSVACPLPFNGRPTASVFKPASVPMLPAVIRITAGNMGTLAGLKTDAVGRPLNGNGHATDGLCAVGNDMANVFQGACPGGGITLGPGMTFGYLAGLHAADRLSARPVAAV